jgi:hypothetical protein
MISVIAAASFGDGDGWDVAGSEGEGKRRGRGKGGEGKGREGGALAEDPVLSGNLVRRHV